MFTEIFKLMVDKFYFVLHLFIFSHIILYLVVLYFKGYWCFYLLICLIEEQIQKHSILCEEAIRKNQPQKMVDNTASIAR